MLFPGKDVESTWFNQNAHNVQTTLIQRQDVESTLFQRCVPAG